MTCCSIWLIRGIRTSLVILENKMNNILNNLGHFYLKLRHQDQGLWSEVECQRLLAQGTKTKTNFR